ncbi:MAG: HipA domain-containing protein [Sandaracinaceae bacterium]|nr:HipA domain-containing protein [Sandaracinaceae bacterium]
MTVDTLYASINGVHVGELRRGAGGLLSFTYAPTWLTDARATPISLSIPLGRREANGPAVQHYFAGLLPDRDDVRALLRRTLSARSERPFDLLAAMGRDCVGALELSEVAPHDVALEVPAQAPMRDRRAAPSAQEGAPLGTRLTRAQVAKRLAQLGEFPLGMGEADVFRLSLAGAQSKTALLLHEGVWYAPTPPTPSTHILKPQMGVLEVPRGRVSMHDSVENEWLCLRLLSALGLPTATCTIETFARQRVLSVQRFDRKLRVQDGAASFVRFPQEDLCQALGVSPHDKYESDGGPDIPTCMELLGRVSTAPDEDRRVFFTAQLAQLLLAAPDGHAKNYSLFLLPGGRASLTPLYDVLSAYPMVARGEWPVQRVDLAMSFRGKSKHYRWRDVRMDHVRQTAERCRVTRETVDGWIADLLARVPRALAATRRALPRRFPPEVADPIFEGVTKAAARFGLP